MVIAILVALMILGVLVSWGVLIWIGSDPWNWRNGDDT